MKLFVLLLCSLVVVVTACKKTATTDRSSSSQTSPSPTDRESAPLQFDACGLITREEIEAIVWSSLKDTKSSERSSGGLRMSQCFFTAAEFNKSVSLEVTQSDPDSPAKRSAKDFWTQTLGRSGGDKKEHEGDKEKKESLKEQSRDKGEERESIPPRKIDGTGDEAYWIGNRVGGALYVLKKNAFIRVSVGGADSEESKIKKSQALAEKVLKRL